MTTYLIILVLFLVVYQNRVYGSKKYNSAINNRWLLVIYLAIMILPIVLVSTFLPANKKLEANEFVEISEKYGGKDKREEAYRLYAKDNKNDINAQIRYIDYKFKLSHDYLYVCQKIESLYRNEKSDNAILLKWYVNKKCENQEPEDSVLSYLPVNMPGLNFVKAFAAEKDGNPEKAIDFYLQEIQHNPEIKSSYQNLFGLLLKNDRDKLNDLMSQKAFAKNIDPKTRRVYHFNFGSFSYYLKEIFNFYQKIPRVSTFIIALLASLIWVIYLWKLDVFNREKWYDLAAVFILGALAAYGCTIFYDYASFNLNFSINGEAWNDFLYCTIVIGGSKELVKFIPWIIFGLLANKLKEPFDFILYASVSALGFAFAENLIYFENFFNIVKRTMISTVSHMFDASIVAFAFIIAKYRLPKGSKFKLPVIILGFLLAMLAHGFYDFWLISPNYQDKRIFTYVFFILSLHTWFYFKNNAINHSPFFCNTLEFNKYKKQDLLNLSFIALLMLQFLVVSFEMGGNAGFDTLFMNGFLVAVFLVYIHYQLNLFSLEKKVWRKLNLEKAIPLSEIGKNFHKLSEMGYQNKQSNTKSDSKQANYIGLALRLFAPKDNPYVGSELPVSGTCVKRVTVAQDPNWYLFKLNKKLSYKNYVDDRILIKNKNKGENLSDDKIEIYFLFIPNESLLKLEDIPIEKLRYVGRTYSRPI